MVVSRYLVDGIEVAPLSMPSNIVFMRFVCNGGQHGKRAVKKPRSDWARVW